ncbi:MAG: hypothetical protein IKE41_02060 [Clostridia bacterium]|nr:hypothetical protein [Clostridia bacterium]MBR2735557.1 hypothetical protein [Clostridia bacterium]
MKQIKLTKKWWTIIISAIIVLVAGGVLLFVYNSHRVLTKSEYIKEVTFQKEDFDDLLSKYFDQISSYNGTKESTEKLEATANKFSEFVEELKKQLGPKVPSEASGHYRSMMAAYDIYLEAVNMYKKAVPKPLGEERTTLLNEASQKMNEAQDAMKNIK